MNYLSKKDEAVSPVVGVMLMLVVTIIIAAVVSGFAGGLSGENQKAPQASIIATDFVVKGVIDSVATDTPPPPVANVWGQGQWQPDQGATNPAADIYVVFEHMGGDSLNLENIELYLGKLSEPQMGSFISRALEPQNGPEMTTSQNDFGTIGVKADIPGWSAGWSDYLEKYPDRDSVVIKPGDRFVLHADYGARDVDGNNRIMWLQEGGDYPFPIGEGDVLTYDIIDKNSDKIICSGQIGVPEFGVGSS